MPRNLRPVPNYPTVANGKAFLRHRQKGYVMKNYMIPKSIILFLEEHGSSTVSQMVEGMEFHVVGYDEDVTDGGVSRGTLNQALDAMEDSCLVEGSGGRGQVWTLVGGSTPETKVLFDEIMASNHTSSRVSKPKGKGTAPKTPKTPASKPKVVKTDLSFDGAVIDADEREVPLDMKRRYVVIGDLLYLAPKGLTWLGIDDDNGHHWEKSEREAMASSLYNRPIEHPGVAIHSVSAKEALAIRDNYIEEWQAERHAEDAAIEAKALTKAKQPAKKAEQPKDEIAAIVSRFKSKMEKIK